MTPFTPERIEQLNNGYGLDGGGYSWENVEGDDHPLAGLACVVWEDPDLDYFLGGDIIDREHRGKSLLLAFAPNSGHFPATEWPAGWPGPWEGTRHVKVVEGRVNETDRECDCHGKLVEHTGAAGEPREALDPAKAFQWLVAGLATAEDPEGTPTWQLIWEYTGDSSDKPHPDCTRCEGSGYVNSSGGEWAIYAIEDIEESDEEACDCCGELAELNNHHLCEGCQEDENDFVCTLDPAGGDEE